MSKQVNRVNIEPEICMGTGLPTRSIISSLTLLLLVKLTSSFLTILYKQSYLYTMQELVKEVTLINHTRNAHAHILPRAGHGRRLRTYVPSPDHFFI